MMTQLSKEDHQAMMADMRRFDEQMPCVGIFWYDPAEKCLFGVRKQELTPKMTEEAAEKGLPFINYPHLHRQVWAKEHFRAEAKQEETKFKGDYTQVPHGQPPQLPPRGLHVLCSQECRALCPPSGGEGGAGNSASYITTLNKKGIPESGVYIGAEKVCLINRHRKRTT